MSIPRSEKKGPYYSTSFASLESASWRIITITSDFTKKHKLHNYSGLIETYLSGSPCSRPQLSTPTASESIFPAVMEKDPSRSQAQYCKAGTYSRSAPTHSQATRFCFDRSSEEFLTLTGHERKIHIGVLGLVIIALGSESQRT
jgi:hypothetical protein